MDKEQTKVIFRMFKDNGEIIALFPDVPWDVEKRYCTSYMHIGQHGAADYRGIFSSTIEPDEVEYKELKEELESLGYNLLIRKRKR